MEDCGCVYLTFLLWLTGLEGFEPGPVQETNRVTMIPYTPQDRACLHLEEYYNDSLGLCCSKCQPGMWKAAPCSRDRDTDCTRCPDGTHTEVWNVLGHCLSCRGRCRAELGLIELQNCTAHSKRICGCKPGTFCKSGVEQGDTTCTECASHHLCPPGQGVMLAGNHSDDTVCEVCDEGTFSNESSATSRCQPHKDCSKWSQVASKPGNSTTDTVCHRPEEGSERRTGERDGDSTSVSLAVLSAILFVIVVVTISVCLSLGRHKEQAIPLSCVKKVFRTCITDPEAQDGDDRSSEGVRTDHLLCPTGPLHREAPPCSQDPPAETNCPRDTLPTANETLVQSCDPLNQSGSQAPLETNNWGLAMAKEGGASSTGIVGPVYIYNPSQVYVGLISSERRGSAKGLLAREGRTAAEDGLRYPQQELGEGRATSPEQERGKESHLSEKVSEGS